MIRIESLEKTYGRGATEVRALRGVSFEVTAGDYVAIMGPSGSGKSTLMNVLGCLDHPTAGRYTLDGIDVEGLTARETAVVRNQKIGFVFQSFNLLPGLTAFRNVELPLIYAGVPEKERVTRVEEALARVGLSDRTNHRPSELSGGQRQRVAVARALVNRPAILLADEPTGNLDSVSSAEVLDLFSELHEAGATILMVTHEHDVAAHARRVLHFKDGQLDRIEVNQDA